MAQKLEASSQSSGDESIESVASSYLVDWPGSYRYKINRSIQEINDNKTYLETVNSSHIDHRTWNMYVNSIRRRLVKKPVELWGSEKEFVEFCRMLDEIPNSSKNKDGEKFESYRTRNASTSSKSNVSKIPTRNLPEMAINESNDPQVDIIKQNLNDHLFHRIYTLAQRDLEGTILSYKALSNVSDLRIPHEWYPYARLMKRKIIYHGGPTNSGKTYHALQRLAEADPNMGGGLYCGPLRLLALEVYENLNRKGIPTDLLTGQEKRVLPYATHISSTLEMVNIQKDFDVAVIDEIQMIAHEQRGHAWTRALHGLRAREIHVCGGLEALNIVRNLVEDAGDDFELIEYKRLSKLKVYITILYIFILISYSNPNPNT
jgi:hypothetical protein